VTDMQAIRSETSTDAPSLERSVTVDSAMAFVVVDQLDTPCRMRSFKRRRD
jgi:hypothetical protein